MLWPGHKGRCPATRCRDPHSDRPPSLDLFPQAAGIQLFRDREISAAGVVFTFMVFLSLLVVWGGSRIADARFQYAETLEKKVVDRYIATGAVSTSSGDLNHDDIETTGGKYRPCQRPFVEPMNCKLLTFCGSGLSASAHALSFLSRAKPD